MFRWLRDRSKKSRKASTGSKEDDYGFRQNAPGEYKAHSAPWGEYKAPGAPGEYKRDLPPTPADLMTSCKVTASAAAVAAAAASAPGGSGDDDRSVHIYEEIPDLPFRCTPEGELRIILAQEAAAASRKGAKLSSATASTPIPGHSAGARNISPYMVVPLEFRGDRPDAPGARGARDRRQPLAPGDGGGSAPPFACALVGRKRTDDNHHQQHQQQQQQQQLATSSPSCGSTCSPISCCSSSVFGSTLDGLGRCGSAGGDGGDISDRLLNAINLTRLLAAVRLSSSSADTCTTSPICIGVDKDGRNISVSVSVTPTNAGSNNSTAKNNCHTSPPYLPPHDHDGSGLKPADDIEVSAIADTAAGGSSSKRDVAASETETGLTPAAPLSAPASANLRTGFGVSKTQDGGVFRSHSGSSEATLLNSSGRVAGSSTSSSGSTAKPEAEPEPEPEPEPAQPHHLQTGLRFLPSPLEQNALSEILQLRPGETTELDPAAIDALLLKLCSHTLHSDGEPGESKAASSSSSWPLGSSLQRHELEDVERTLKEMVRQGETERTDPRRYQYHHHHHHHHHHHQHQQLASNSSSASTSALYSRRRPSRYHKFNGQSPGGARRRGENSDTGFEYDVSTSSESDHTNYDYFLSKVARTRSLECRVKKLIRRCSDSSPAESDDEEDIDEENDDDDEEDYAEDEEEEEEEEEEEDRAACGQGGAGDVSKGPETRRRQNGGRPRPAGTDGEAGADSDDGTMADLSESENSSGYYEPVPGQPSAPGRTPASATPPSGLGARATGLPAKLHPHHGKKRKPPLAAAATASQRPAREPEGTKSAPTCGGGGGEGSQEHLVASETTPYHASAWKKPPAEALASDSGKTADRSSGVDGPADGGGKTGSSNARAGPSGGPKTGPSAAGAKTCPPSSGVKTPPEGAKAGNKQKKPPGAAASSGDRKKAPLGTHVPALSERRTALLYGTTTTTTAAAATATATPTPTPTRRKRRKTSAGKDGEEERHADDLEVQCYELHYSAADGYESYDPLTGTSAASSSQGAQDYGSSAECLARIYAPLSELQRSLAAPACLASSSSSSSRSARRGHPHPHPDPHPHLPRAKPAKGSGGRKGRSSQPHPKLGADGSPAEGGGRESRRDAKKKSVSGRRARDSDSRARASHARSSSLGDRVGGGGGGGGGGDARSTSSGEGQWRRGSADAASFGGRRPGGKAGPLRAPSSTSLSFSSAAAAAVLAPSPAAPQSTARASSCHHTYSFLYHSPGSILAGPSSSSSSSSPRSHHLLRGGGKAPASDHRVSSSSRELNRTASFHSDYHYHYPDPVATTTTTTATTTAAAAAATNTATDNGVVYESGRQASDVYSLADGGEVGGGSGKGALRTSASVPNKLSVARQVPESSEVYGTRAGLLGGSNNNRLLSDLILLNYNRQVLNM